MIYLISESRAYDDIIANFYATDEKFLINILEAYGKEYDLEFKDIEIDMKERIIKCKERCILYYSETDKLGNWYENFYFILFFDDIKNIGNRGVKDL